MEGTVMVGKNEVKMRASALIPRLYRFKFGRDMITDMNKLKKAYDKAAKLPKTATEEEREDAQFSALDLTIFENVAYIMAKHADNTQPDNPDEWLDQYEMFSVYEVLPQIIKLWGLSTMTTSEPKKK